MTDGGGTRVERNCAAEAQHKSHHWSEQISAGIFESVIFQPIGPHFAPVALNGESRSVAIEKAKILSTGEQTGPQVWLAVSNAV